MEIEKGEMDDKLSESSGSKSERDGGRERREIGEKLGESSGYNSEGDGDRERREMDRKIRESIEMDRREMDREFRENREMDRKLYEAAISGDLRLLDDEPFKEHIRSLRMAEENPLHIASWLGRVDFVKRVLRLNQSLTHGLNSQRLSPLHLASLKGHEEVAEVLVNSDGYFCFFRDKKGRTPLHIAAEKGRLEMLKALVKAEPKAAWMMTDGGDPILHVCINHNHFDIVCHLLEELKITAFGENPMHEFINLTDDDGNTILHLLAIRGQHKVIAYLCRHFKAQLDINAVNIHRLTALDISMQHSIHDCLEVKKILLEEGARTAEELYEDGPAVVYQKRIKNLQLEKCLEWVSKTRETLMVVAILMATVTFQAGMNPPGGVWQSNDPNNKEIRAGESIMSYIDPRRYILFMIVNSLGFVASLSLIVVLVGRFSVNDKVTLWTTMVWISVISIMVIYTFSLSFLTSKNVGARWSLISYGWGLTLIGVLLFVRFPRPVTWLFDRLGVTWLLNKIHNKYQDYILKRRLAQRWRERQRQNLEV